MNVLLIEPAYKNKYPPIGLMKIATYHKMRGDNVTFYKGRIKDLILDTMVNRVITNWLTQFPGFSKTTIPCNHIRKYICTGSKISLSSVEKVIGNHSDIIQYLIHIRKKFFNKTYLNDSPGNGIVYTLPPFLPSTGASLYLQSLNLKSSLNLLIIFMSGELQRPYSKSKSCVKLHLSTTISSLACLTSQEG